MYAAHSLSEPHMGFWVSCSRSESKIQSTNVAYRT
nr:MAG TPA: short chain dehydrogenase or reductase [Caudoviricetes sp.]